MGHIGRKARVAQLVAYLLILFPSPLLAQVLPPGEEENGFSTLDEINVENVNRLSLALVFRTGAAGPHTSAPLPDGNLLLVLTPFPHTLFALDLSQRDAPLKWKYTPTANATAAGLSCCDEPEGGLTAWDDRIYLSTFDGHVIALQRDDGRPLWDIAVAHPESGEVLTTPALPLDDTIVIGTSGDDAGARGALIALNAATGSLRWKMFSTGPDQQVGIGPAFHTLDASERDSQLGVKTWPLSAWQQGGGGLASALRFDPASGLLFQATGHPAPWNPDQRDGDNRWTSGIFARDADTGGARWFDAINPHDLFALGAAGGLILLRDGNGSTKLIHPDANGYLYVLDGSTGEIVSAQAYLPVTTSSGVDRSNGHLRRRADKRPQPNSVLRDICPAWPAGSNSAPAYSPRTKLIYLAVSQLCMDMEPVNTSYIAGTLFTGANLRLKPAAGKSPGALIAWDLAKGAPAWKIPEKLPLRSGALATQGGIVFYGTLDGAFNAMDARNGKSLWRFATSSGIVARPASFQGPDGHQYVAVLAGSGGLTNPKGATEIDPRDVTAAHGLAALFGSTSPPQDASGTLYVFRLP
jgi:PQQ-dependent dehydrogenase (methanol/ethanol family)